MTAPRHIGETIGTYRIEGLLGEGGMGAVYAASHTLLGRKAAVKVLLPQYSHNEEIVARFFNEAKATTAVEHAGIIQVFDYGHHTDGSAFLVMELLQGESLERRLARVTQLPIDDALRITRQIASALAAAHDAGVIHRDLKPDNVFLVPDPEIEGGERIKVLDFGIAKLADEDGGSQIKTRVGSVLGTPWYMAPEQCSGAGEIDTRADIYSLGCVLFHLLCGRAPFVYEGSGDIMAAHLLEPPPSPRRFAPSVSPEVEALVLRALAKTREQRFATMAEFADNLAAVHRARVTGAYFLSGPYAAALAPRTGENTTLSGAASQVTGAAAIALGPPPNTSPRRARRAAALAVVGLVTALAAVVAISGINRYLGGGASGATAASATLSAQAGEASTPKVGAAETAEAAQTAAPAQIAAAGDIAAPAETSGDASQDGADSRSGSGPGEIEFAPEPAHVDVTIEITSDPPGVDVSNADGEIVGQTPYRLNAPARDAAFVFTLDKDGFASERVELPGDRGGVLTVALRPDRDRRRARRSRRSSDRDARQNSSERPDRAKAKEARKPAADEEDFGYR